MVRLAHSPNRCRLPILAYWKERHRKAKENHDEPAMRTHRTPHVVRKQAGRSRDSADRVSGRRLAAKSTWADKKYLGACPGMLAPLVLLGIVEVVSLTHAKECWCWSLRRRGRIQAILSKAKWSWQLLAKLLPRRKSIRLSALDAPIGWPMPCRFVPSA